MSGIPPSGLDATAVHALSNHLVVILGFVELVLADTPADDTRRIDLLEIRDAAFAASDLIARSAARRTSEPAEPLNPLNPLNP